MDAICGVFPNGKRTTQGVEITREPGIRLTLVGNCLKSFGNSANLKVANFDGVISFKYDFLSFPHFCFRMHILVEKKCLKEK